MPTVSSADNWNLERHVGSDPRFHPYFDSFRTHRYDFHDPETGERRRGLLLYEALRLKNDLDEAAGRL